jgi:hypothetical protein
VCDSEAVDPRFNDSFKPPSHSRFFPKRILNRGAHDLRSGEAEVSDEQSVFRDFAANAKLLLLGGV